uniref:Transposase (putative) gypsy type domain-containing protein n=1 Tax=Cannabis sativa TaxID=3483 RepID=A0A803NVW6_CANSA
MVQELAEPITLDMQDSESTVYSFAYSRIAPDVEVEEMGVDIKLPDCEVEDDADDEGSETDLVDNAELDEPFFCEDLRPHLLLTNPAIIPTQNVVVSIPILHCGVMLPFHLFIKAILTHYDVSPFQLTPNSNRLIFGFYTMYMEYTRGEPTIEDFSYFYNIKSVGHDNGFYCFSKWTDSEINGVEDTISNMGNWKLKWFYAFKMLGVRIDFNR